MIEKQTKSIFINGEWRPLEEDKKVKVVNPATLETISEVAYGGRKEANEAIQAASDAFASWSELSGRERSKILYKSYELMIEDADRLASILTTEQGKPLSEAKGEILGSAQALLWYAEEASRAYGEWIPSSNTSKRLLVVPTPVGVVGAITPWNFPTSMITRKVGPALAAGCTVVLKPATVTPLSAVEVVKIFERAGMPKGVVNLVTGHSKEIGEAMLSSNIVRMITFTGSTEVGKYLMREGSDQLKKLSLELGGHAPIIVCEDADLEKAATLSLASTFRNSGQTCICANRLYVDESVAEEFSQIMKHKVSELKVGSGLEDGTDLGPLINEDAQKKVQTHVEDAVSKGAKVIHGGKKWEGKLDGYFYEPTVISNVSDDMIVMTDETFGPLIPIQTFSDVNDAIAKANDSEYGLAAYVFTEKTKNALRVSEQLDYGIIGVNDATPSVAEAPFGGIKQSGHGKEGGHHGMEEFLEQKFISIGLD